MSKWRKNEQTGLKNSLQREEGLFLKERWMSLNKIWRHIRIHRAQRRPLTGKRLIAKWRRVTISWMSNKLKPKGETTSLILGEALSCRGLVDTPIKFKEKLFSQPDSIVFFHISAFSSLNLASDTLASKTWHGTISILLLRRTKPHETEN